jgi:hypothetical protein
MQRNGHDAHVDAVAQYTPLLPGTVPLPKASPSTTVIEWDWDVEHYDRQLEAKADAALHGAQPFQVDRRVLKDVVRETMGCDVGRIKFLSSGTSSSSAMTIIDETLSPHLQALFIRLVLIL